MSSITQLGAAIFPGQITSSIRGSGNVAPSTGIDFYAPAESGSLALPQTPIVSARNYYCSSPAGSDLPLIEYPTRLRPFVKLGYPEGITRDLVERLLQQFTDQVFSVGFRYLGEQADFFHGHFLFRKSDPKPVAILYHTQEDAYDYNRKTPGHKYDYLNRETRNWVQLMGEDGRIINANGYIRRPETIADFYGVDAMRRNPRFTPEMAEAFIRRAVISIFANYESHRTILSVMLDPNLFGGELDLTMSYNQWQFIRVDRKSLPEVIPEDFNVVKVRLPNGEEVYLVLS